MKDFGHIIIMTLLAVVLCGGLTACDKLSDDDDMVTEVLPGTWAFSYELQSEEDTGLSFSYDHVIFRTDGTVSIVSPDGTMEGTYRAGSAVIRIEGKTDDGEDRQMLWRILTFSNQQITAEYEFEFGEQNVIAIVTLDRTDSLE